MSYFSTKLVYYRCVFCSLLKSTLPLPEHLQECLTLETSNPAFTELPFRYMEISKVLLDVFASFLSFSLASSILM